eukprot:CAMPEP_0171281810 /NCGR_PEP_ID=MMETSP0790-20130122/66592_1 /TAXON_ID=2925 /ORGANISM="Alexandrium catenella, Strain OF101" /LENGTH=77 /DNA_ID=CAMNT_0011751041 /DNA_START=26 /DNA_END=256 /DNA_ORIENTATION=+
MRASVSSTKSLPPVSAMVKSSSSLSCVLKAHSSIGSEFGVANLAIVSGEMPSADTKVDSLWRQASAPAKVLARNGNL